MPTPNLTLEETLAFALRSSQPIVFVEGCTDLEILRALESRIGLPGSIVVQPCGGGVPVTEIERKSRRLKLSKVAFLLDRDLDVFLEKARARPRVVRTWGYSIENDVIAGSEIGALLTEEEKEKFDRLLDLLCRWFAFELHSSAVENRDPIIRVSVESLVDPLSVDYRPVIARAPAMRSFGGGVFPTILRDPHRYLRGKQLLGIYQLILNSPGRPARLNKAAILGVCSRMGANRHLGALAARIRKNLRR
jgi:hypothetical protein